MVGWRWFAYMVTLKDIIKVASDLNAEVKINVDGQDIEVQEIIIDCVDGKIYLYDCSLVD